MVNLCEVILLDYKSLLSLMNQRQSIRKFKEKEISKELIEKIIQAGVTAPSAFNSQPWKFAVIQNQEKKQELNLAYSSLRKKFGWYEQDTSFIENSVPIIVLCDEEDYLKEISCALAIQNMLLASKSLGLGSLTIGAFSMNAESEEELKKIVSAKKEEKVVLVCLFGYKDETPERKTRKSIEEVVEFS